MGFLQDPRVASLGGPLSVKPKALFVGQRSVQEAGPGVAWGCLTAWGFPPFPVARSVSLVFPLRFQQGGHRVQDGRGARHGSQALGEVQILLDNQRDIKTGGSEVLGADDGAVPARVPVGRRPRTKRVRSGPTAAARARPLGKRNSNFPDLVVLPQRMGTAAASGLGAGELGTCFLSTASHSQRPHLPTPCRGCCFFGREKVPNCGPYLGEYPAFGGPSPSSSLPLRAGKGIQISRGPS